MSLPESESRRQRPHTVKGESYFQERFDYHSKKVSKVGEKIDIILKSVIPNTEEDIVQLKLSVENTYRKYSDLCTELLDLLSKHDTEDSAGEKENIESQKDLYWKKVSDFIVELENTLTISRKKHPPPNVCDYAISRSTGSQRSSRSSRSSSRMSATTVLGRHRAKLDGAQAKLQYAKKEADMKREAALLSIKMELMQVEKEAAIASAEYTGMKQELYDDTKSDFSDEDKSDIVNRYLDSMVPTSVNQKNTQFQPMTSQVTDFVYPSAATPISAVVTSSSIQFPGYASTTSYAPVSETGAIYSHIDQSHLPVSTLNPTTIPSYSSVIVPTTSVTMASTSISPVMSNTLSNPTTITPQSGLTQGAPGIYSVPLSPARNSTSVEFSEFSNYLMKRDILPLRVIEFDDKPETYQAWKVSFDTLKSELRATPREELDLLIKYLGPKSKQHALSIRSANANCPSHAVELIWKRLAERYGSPVLMESSLKSRLEAFPQITPKDSARLYDLVDLLTEIQSRMEDPTYRRSLSSFDSSAGMRPIVSKLPFSLQEKWTSRASIYNTRNQVTYPPFTFLVEFINEMSRIRNDPGFSYQTTPHHTGTPTNNNRPRDARAQESSTRKPNVRVKKTDVNDSPSVKDGQCMLHDAKHSLNECKTFQKLTINERKKLLKDYKFCFKCCSSTKHNYKVCHATVKCDSCGSISHTTAMHVDNSNRIREPTAAKTHFDSQQGYGGEESHVAKCTTICGQDFKGRSCAKTCLVRVYPKDKPHLGVSMYALLDDQSTSTLARTEFFDMMNIARSTMTSYTLTSCSGQCVMSGRQAKGFIVESADGTSCLELPVITECSEIPDERSEIPTPDITRHYEHLEGIPIPALNAEAPILLLIGRDLPEAHHIETQCTGPKGTPFAQKSKLGWVLIGNVCLGNSHPPNEINVLKTCVGKDGRVSIFTGCESNFSLKVDNSNLFQRDTLDDTIGLSIEDKKFLCLMDQEFNKTQNGNWSAPLPFKEGRAQLPNNRSVALKRAITLQSSLRKNPEKRGHFVTFIQRMLDLGHAELAPTLTTEESEVWYLPLFGVYHHRKADQVRIVFDSSCKHEGLSLNSVLMQGPDLMNRLDGVLLRFRKEPVAVIADIQQMFFGFYVHECHRDYLRFFWHRDNDPGQPLVEYRMCVHVFGNSPSPAVATYGLRKCVDERVNPCDKDVQEFVTRNFYVDDGLMSFGTADEAADVLKRTQKALMDGGNLRLHKIASNSEDVMSQFPSSDLAKTVQPLNLERDDLPLHRSLGLEWDLSSDTFTFHTADGQKLCTKRGLLSTVNGIFDPLGFLSPIVIQGKIVMRDAVNSNVGWDDPVPPQIEKAWKTWMEQLGNLNKIHIPRCFLQVSFSNCHTKTLHIFSDASDLAVATCAYVRVAAENDGIYIGFVFGKSKLAPKHGHTTPRLELCAAVMATEVAQMLSRELDLPLEDMHFYTDSNVVLGYLSNERRRFYVYVSNRVSRIRNVSSPEQWHHVSSEENPADEGTRGLLPEQFMNSLWFNGPAFLRERNDGGMSSDVDYPLVEPDIDKEIRPEVCVMKTISKSLSLGTSRFKRFSTWDSLVCAIRAIRLRMRRQVNIQEDLTRREVELYILKQSQLSDFSKEIQALRDSKPIPRDSPVLSLNLFLDEQGLLRVGGRIRKGNFSDKEKTPILISGRNHVAKLLAQHHHDKVQHQGRHFTEGAVRSAGLWITGGKRLVSSYIYHCVTCRRMRGKLACQKMADLPQDRLTPSPPFSFVGVDVFGPWSVITRRTRGGSANSKRWAVLFTCLYSRAVHIEVIAEMTSSAFINAMRRFIALRGNVSEFRSDCGTNFVGAVNELGMDQINVGDSHLKSYLDRNNIVWRFNPPHSSHFGGTWERMIGVARRILDAMLLDVKHGKLTDEVLSTLMAEVTAIINSRPLVPLTSDAEMPQVLSPGILLTQKTNDGIAPEFQSLKVQDMYRSQWRMVQVMADTFWKRWRSEFLSTLQGRSKWNKVTANLKCGDVVLLRDKECPRMNWPTGVVTKTFPSEDGLVRKLEIRIVRDGKQCVFLRPITEVVPLISD